jgi:chromosomal replication initiator protein
MDVQSITAGQVWQEALTRIESQLSKPSFEAFLKAMRPLALQHDVFVFSVPSMFAKEWLEGRYRGLIAETLREVLTRGVDIRFIVAEGDSGQDAGTSTASEAVRRANGAAHLGTQPTQHTAVSLDGRQALTGKYTFDTFVVGAGNRFAHAAAKAVAEAPARAYNPLFIYGGVGLGKTHLLQAIGHHVLSHSPAARVMYVSSERFTNDLINAIRDDRMVEFRHRYRNVDVLAIDDIQFLAGKERTQEEFFHTFNTLHESSRQLIISSDRAPREIPTLEDRLR